MKRTPTAQPKVDITPETLYNFTKLMEQCAPLAALLENHKSDPSGVLESEMKGVSDMAKRHKQRVKIGVNENGDSVYKWADGYSIDELNDNIVRIYIENGLLDRVKSDQPPRQKIDTKGECPTFREYVPKWFATFKEYQLKPNTIKGYRSNFRRHIYPFFGDMKLDEITTDHSESPMSLFFFETILNQSPKTLFKPSVIFFRPLGRTFQVILALATGNLRHMSLHQQTVNILVRVPASALMDGFRTFPQRQRRNTVVLRDDNITSLAEVDQRDIHRISPGPDHPYLTVIRVQDVIRVAKQHNRDGIFL